MPNFRIARKFLWSSRRSISRRSRRTMFFIVLIPTNIVIAKCHTWDAREPKGLSKPFTGAIPSGLFSHQTSDKK